MVKTEVVREPRGGAREEACGREEECVRERDSPERLPLLLLLAPLLGDRNSRAREPLSAATGGTADGRVGCKLLSATGGRPGAAVDDGLWALRLAADVAGAAGTVSCQPTFLGRAPLTLLPDGRELSPP